MKLSTFLLPVCAATVFSFASCDKSNDDEVNTTDKTFISNASLSNNAEIGAASVAVTLATDATVKAYAQEMITAHTTAQNDLKTLGAQVNVAVTDSVDANTTALVQQLNGLQGRDFDSVYIWSQVAAHQAALANFQTEQDNGRHSDVKRYANTYKPNIQMHYAMADSISRRVFPRP